MRFLATLLSFLMLSSTTGAVADSNTGKGAAKVLSVNDYTELLKKEDAEIQRYVHQRMQTRFQTDLALADSAWVLSLTNTHGIAIGNNPTTRRTDVGLLKNFRSTGTDIEVGYNTNTLADRQEEIQFLQLRQSLLRNFFGQRLRTQEEGLELQNQVTLWQVVETYEDYMAEKLGQYLDFVLAWQNYNTAEQQLREITSIWKEVKQRKRNNIALSVDLNRAEVQKIQYERNLLEAKQDMQRLRKLLLARIDTSVSAFEPSGEVPFINDTLVFSKERSEFLKKGRTIRIHQVRQQSVEKLKEATERRYYPEAQLILGYSQDQSQRFSTIINREEKVVGFNFTYEFDSSQRGAQVAQAQYNVHQTELQNLSERKQITTLIDNLKDQIVLQKQRVDLLKRQVAVSKKLVQGETGRFRKGRVDLETLITTQNSYHQARYDLLAQKVLLARHTLNWKVLLDQLVSSEIFKD